MGRGGLRLSVLSVEGTGGTMGSATEVVSGCGGRDVVGDRGIGGRSIGGRAGRGAAATLVVM